MKIFAFRQGDRRLLGIVDGAILRNLSAALESAGVVDSEHDLLRNDFFRPQRIVAFMKRWRRFATKLDGPIVYEPPVLPGKILLIGRNFEEHAKELGNKSEDDVLHFAKLPESVLGHEGTIAIPAHVKRADHEAELAIIVARDGAHISESKAFSFVGGYTCLLDVTARDQQLADKAKQRPWLRSKSYDTFCPMGPFLVPVDDVLDPNHLTITCRVNGVVRQVGNTSDWIHKIPSVIATLSAHTTLRAGDVISMGTPAGVGPLEPGDVIEVEISDVGLLRNKVAAVVRSPPVDKGAAFEALRPQITEAILTARDGGEAFERTVALLDTIPHFHWTGIYRVEPDGSLGLGPFRGKPTVHTKISAGKGVCGRAIVDNRTVVVDDVTKDSQYLACALETRSEIVVPIRAGGKAVAELDIDSDHVAAFDKTDREFLESVAAEIGDYLSRTQLPRMWDDR